MIGSRENIVLKVVENDDAPVENRVDSCFMNGKGFSRLNLRYPTLLSKQFFKHSLIFSDKPSFLYIKIK